MLPRLTLLCAFLLSALLAAPSSVLAGEFAWSDDTEASELTLTYGDKPVLRYMYAYDTSSDERAHETYKVYHHAFGPESGEQITKGPHGKFTHHRGLYVGWNKTNVGDETYDFWHCKNGAHLRHVKILKQEATDKMATMTALIHWNTAEGEPVIEEERTVTVTPAKLESAKAYQIDWSTKLSSKMGDIELTGDRQHAGFQYRAAQAVADADSARYIRPEGVTQQEEAYQVDDSGNPPRHINLNWFAMTYPIEGNQYTVEYFPKPGQPEPALYSERPYGRFGTFYKTELTEDNPLEMNYRLVISEGETPSRDAIQARYDEFVSE